MGPSLAASFHEPVRMTQPPNDPKQPRLPLAPEPSDLVPIDGSEWAFSVEYTSGRFHAHCLRSTPLAPTPGRILVSYIGDSEDPDPPLTDGRLLFVETTASLKAAVAPHLSGPTPASEFRYGIAAALGFGPEAQAGELSIVQEALIDRWIDDFTIFHLEEVDSAVDTLPAGLFNGAWRRA